jgi:hypothetical protein
MSRPARHLPFLIVGVSDCARPIAYMTNHDVVFGCDNTNQRSG